MAGRCRTAALVGLTFAGMLAFAQTGVEEPPRADFKGARLGMALGEWRAVNNGYFNRKYSCGTPDNRVVGDLVCNVRPDQHETIAGAQARVMQFRFHGDELTSIGGLFDSGEFRQVADALAERLGPPTGTRRGPVHSGPGVTFWNEEQTWKVGTDTIDVEKHSVTFGDASIEYESLKGKAESKARSKLRASEGKKDL
jgi:hypothetical protein